MLIIASDMGSIFDQNNELYMCFEKYILKPTLKQKLDIIKFC